MHFCIHLLFSANAAPFIALRCVSSCGSSQVDVIDPHTVCWTWCRRSKAVPAGLPASSQDGQRRVSPDVGHNSGDEASLVRAAQAGDRSAFAILIERYWDRLYRWLCHLTRDRHRAEDLTQETFLKAFAAVNSFRAGSNFRAWLFRIAHNNFVNQRRAVRHNRQPLVPEVAGGSARAGWTRSVSREAVRRIAEGGGQAAERLPGGVDPPGGRGAVVPRHRGGDGDHRGDGPVAGVQGPPEADGGAGPGPAAHRTERANVIMNCSSARSRLLAVPDPADVPEVVAGHLAACALCSAWHSLLVQVDAVVAADSVPASDGRVKEQLDQSIPIGAVSAKPAKPSGKSAPKLGKPVVVPAAPANAIGDRLARLWPVGLVAAALLVGTLSWVIFGGGSNEQQMIAAERDPMLEKVVKAKVDLDTAETTPQRLKVLDQLAADIHDQATTLSKVTPGKEMESLASMYEQVVLVSLVATARSLSEDERKKLLSDYTERLSKAEQAATRAAGEAPPDSVASLRNMAKVASEGKGQLARMLQGRDL